MVLHQNGLIDYGADSQLTLHPNSRVAWLGIWLVLERNENSRLSLNKPPRYIRLFIFKDSLSEKNIARLSRRILHK